jgi:hypothetical protein
MLLSIVVRRCNSFVSVTNALARLMILPYCYNSNLFFNIYKIKVLSKSKSFLILQAQYLTYDLVQSIDFATELPTTWLTK